MQNPACQDPHMKPSCKKLLEAIQRGPYPDGTCDQCGHKDGSKALQHITDGSPCWCEPETEELEDGSTLFIHRRSDN